MTERVEITLHSSVSEIPAAEWDACACPETADGGRPFDPFTTHRFLAALERSGSVDYAPPGGRVVRGTGWTPRPMLARRGGEVIAALPLYLKAHSQGEYIFDHGWADALARAGRRYYPKLQVAVPFTPVTGRRFLTRPGHEATGFAALVEGMVRVASEAELSSAHVTFCTATEAAWGEATGLMPRVTQQFHWLNRGYADYEAFLADLAARKRKALRKERARAQGFGGTIRALTGTEIEPAHWDAFWTFYQDTGARKWGRPYLTRAFFEIAHAELSDDILLVLAERDGRPVAGALNFIGRDALFGRYWGAVEDHPFLHFELCYHQAIDWAIAHGLARIEAGAQGEHKLARGYLPVPTHSLHWAHDADFARAIGQYLAAERAATDEEIEVLTGYGPFRRGPAPEETD